MMAMARKERPKRGGVKGKQAAPVWAVTVTSWDQGAQGPANRIGLVQESAIEADAVTGEISNPNGVKRLRRVNMLEVWHRKGVISTAGFNVAERIRNAFEATQRAPGWPDNDRVQSSPKPDHAVTIQIDRLSKFEAIMRHVAAEDRHIINVCVIDECTPAVAGYRGRAYLDGLQHLREALDRTAAAIGG